MEGDNIVGVCDDRKEIAAKTTHFGHDHCRNKSGRDCRVDGIAASFKHGDTCGCCQRMGSGDHSAVGKQWRFTAAIPRLIY
jgi:hypothetical protein